MRPFALCGVVLLTACATTSPQRAFDDLGAMIEARTGHRLYWNRQTPEDVQVANVVREMLAGELAVGQAVQIALLNNRELIATYEDLSISQADLVQAGLLKNPVFSIGSTVADADRLNPNLLAGVTWDFLDVFLIPARKKIAKSQLEATKLRVASSVLGLVTEVESAYYTLQAALQAAEMRRVVGDITASSVELAKRQHEAGNISDLAFAIERGMEAQFAADKLRADADIVTARERLTRLMGVWGESTSFRLPVHLPDVPNVDPDGAHLESLAIRDRVDLDALRRNRETLGMALSLATSGRFIPGVGIGVEAGRLTSGAIAVAPSASLELPLFDQKQGTIARLEALFRAEDARMRARAVDIRSEVRSARDRLAIARALVMHYRDVVVPERERIVALSQQEYDAMLMGVYQLLLAKQSEVSAYREYIEAARDYWLARVELEHAVGGRLAWPPPEHPSEHAP